MTITQPAPLTSGTRSRVDADSDHQAHSWLVTDPKLGDTVSQTQSHHGDLSRVFRAVSLRYTADAHVRVANRLNLQAAKQ